MKKIFLFGFCLIFTSAIVSAGFNEFGYNDKARNFVGTGWSWCMGKVGDETWCNSYLGSYVNDKLQMKWNEEWDRGNLEGWSDPNGYHGAWTTNQWNGMAGGSGETWHYIFRWDQGCATNSTPSIEGGYCIWGSFVVSLSHGTDADGHYWDARTKPVGVGPQP